MGYGRSALVESDASATLGILRDRLPDSIDVRPACLGFTAERRWVAADEIETATRVLPEVELWIAEWADERVFVHAGSVALNGRALLLPGRSHAGKTTLTEALLRAGASYLSDEYAVLDPEGFVHPYARPLRLRHGGHHRQVPAAAYGAEVIDHALPVGLVAHLRYEPDAVGIGPVSRGAGALALLENTVCARSRPLEALDATANAVSDVSVLAGARGEAESVAADLLDRLRCSLPELS